MFYLVKWKSSNGNPCFDILLYIDVHFLVNSSVSHTLRKNVQIWSFFWSTFSQIRTEYGELRTVSSCYKKVYWNQFMLGAVSEYCRKLNKNNFMNALVNLSNMFNVYSFFKSMPNQALREKYPNTELFLVRIFLYSNWTWRFPTARKNFVFGHFSRSDGGP